MTVAIDKQTLLKEIATDQGFTDVDAMLEHHVAGGSLPGGCVSCGAIQDQCEPDMENGLCESCDENSVKSIFVLADVI